MFTRQALADRIRETLGRYTVVQTSYDDPRDQWIVEVADSADINRGTALGMRVVIHAEDIFRFEGSEVELLDRVIEHLRHGQSVFNPTWRPATSMTATRIRDAAITMTGSTEGAALAMRRLGESLDQTRAAAQGSSLRSLDRAPINPTVGDFWIDISGDGKVKVWDGSGDWAEVVSTQPAELTDAAKQVLARTIAEEQEMLRRHEEEAREIYEAALRKRQAQ